VNGTGTVPAVTVSPASLSFPSQVVGTTSAARTITVQSTGTGPLQFTSITATAPFAQTNNCGSSIAAGATCTIQVTFTPAASGSASGTVTLVTNAGTQTVALSGAGGALVGASPTSISFGDVVVGTTSAAKTVTFANGQQVVLTITSIVAGGAFGVLTNTCGASLGPGANCTVGVTFSPTALSDYSGTLTFTDGASNSPQTVRLSGTGINLDN
jgi:hypothetical protein